MNAPARHLDIVAMVRDQEMRVGRRGWPTFPPPKVTE